MFGFGSEGEAVARGDHRHAARGAGSDRRGRGGSSEFEREDQRLGRAASDLTSDKVILVEAAQGDDRAPVSGDRARARGRSACPNGAPAAFRAARHRLRTDGGRGSPIHPGEGAAGPGRRGTVHSAADIVALARQHGRYGHRRITARLRAVGWHANRARPSWDHAPHDPAGQWSSRSTERGSTPAPRPAV